MCMNEFVKNCMILWVFIEFFGVKIVIIDIYRYFTDILPIFFHKFQYKHACSTVTILPIFRRYIGRKKRFFVPLLIVHSLVMVVY